MVWPFLFAILIIAVVVLKYLNIGGNRCPQCSAARDLEMPLCGECGWIFDSGPRNRTVMEGVLAILGVGCVFFAFQVVVDYIRYRRVIQPKIERLEALREELRAKIDVTRAGLGKTAGELDPIKDEVGKLEQEYLDLQQQIEQERTKERPRPIRFRS